MNIPKTSSKRGPKPKDDISKKVLVKDKYQVVTPKITNVFVKNLNTDLPVIVNRGGAGSGKTHAMVQLLIYKFLTERNKKILIARKSLPSLRMSVQLFIDKVFEEFNISNRVTLEKVMLNYKFDNNLIHLGSVDNPEKMKCHSEDTDILTKDGFKPIKDVKIGDLVASMNPISREVIYTPITKFYEYEYKGKMFRPSSETGNRRPYVDFCVTPEHKMLYKTRVKNYLRFGEIKNLPQTYILPQSSKWDIGNIIDKWEIPKVPFNKKKTWRYGLKENSIDIIPWLKFFGWYISEGNLNASCTVQLTQVKEEGRKQLIEDLKDFPYKLIDIKDKNIFVIYGKDLTEYLRQFGKSHEKFIPREILNLHPSLLQYLFDTLINGDGSRITKNHITYCTNSKQLRDDISEIAIKLGYIVSYNEIDTKKYYPNAKIAWALNITKRKDVRLTKKEEIDYKGKVYCVEVPPYHTVLTRYNGKIVWSGNSSEWNYIWLEEATDFTYEDFQLIRSRLRAPTNDGKKNQMFLTFNPIDESHWIKTELLAKHDDVMEIQSTYKDNPFLDKDAIEFYEKSIEYDMNFYRIYVLGEWGKLEDLIYAANSWDTCKEFPKDFGNDIYGLDFGYNAPCALTHAVYKEREIWEEELLYQTGLTNAQLIKKLEELIPDNKRHRPIYADSAEPDRIKEIRLAGFNCRPALKNVKDGIDFVKRVKIHITEESISILKEKKSYSWKKDNKRNLIIDEPIPYNDHCMDSERYMLYSHLYNIASYRVRWL